MKISGLLLVGLHTAVASALFEDATLDPYVVIGGIDWDNSAAPTDESAGLYTIAPTDLSTTDTTDSPSTEAPTDPVVLDATEGPYTEAPTDTASFDATEGSSTEAPSDESSFEGTYDPASFPGGCFGSASLAMPSLTFDSTSGKQLYDTYQCGSAYNAKSAGLWYTVSGTGGSIEAALCGPARDYDTMMSVWTGSCSSLQCVDGNDDNCDFGSSVTWASITDVEYYVFVYGYGGDTGNFELSLVEGVPEITPAPSPTPVRTSMEEGCGEANAIASGAIVRGSTDDQPSHSTESCSGADAHDSQGTWYAMEGTGGIITASLCGNIHTNYDTMISVWGGSCSSLTCVAGNDDYCGVGSASEFSTIVGTTYYIFVHGYSSNTGSYELSISGAPTDAPSPIPSSTPSFTPTEWKEGSGTGPCFMEAIVECSTASGRICDNLRPLNGDEESTEEITISYLVRNNGEFDAHLMWGIKNSDFLGNLEEVANPGSTVIANGEDIEFAGLTQTVNLVLAQGHEFKFALDLAGKDATGDVCRASAMKTIRIGEQDDLDVPPTLPTASDGNREPGSIEMLLGWNSTAENWSSLEGNYSFVVGVFPLEDVILTSLQVASSVDPFLFDFTEVVEGINVAASDYFETVVSIPLDLSSASTYELLFEFTAVSISSGNELFASEPMSFTAGWEV